MPYRGLAVRRTGTAFCKSSNASLPCNRSDAAGVSFFACPSLLPLLTDCQPGQFQTGTTTKRSNPDAMPRKQICKSRLIASAYSSVLPRCKGCVTPLEKSARRVTGCAIEVVESARRTGDSAVLVASAEKVYPRARMASISCQSGFHHSYRLTMDAAVSCRL